MYRREATISPTSSQRCYAEQVQLISLSYSQNVGEASEWNLDPFALKTVNLVVGKNASGKTWALNAIVALAGLVAGERRADRTASVKYDAVFDQDGARVQYTLSMMEGAVAAERILKDGDRLMSRGPDGVGKIRAEELNPKEMSFQSPPNEVAAFARRDLIQHPFLEPLFLWGSSLLHYRFGTPLGRDRFAVMMQQGESAFNPKDTEAPVVIFHRGQSQFGDDYVAAIVNDMRDIGYDIENIELGGLIPTGVMPTTPGEFVQLLTKEKTIAAPTQQRVMSQGMFRALSLLIHVNYARLAIKPTCFIIDDIGEGLDYERSCALIDVLMTKASAGGVQLIMSTNDRFVMNNVPLEYWSVLGRTGKVCHVYNHENTSAFKKFKFTGLNNFDFLATDYLNSADTTDAK